MVNLTVDAKKLINILLFVIIFISSIQEFLYSYNAAWSFLFAAVPFFLVISLFSLVFVKNKSKINTLQIVFFIFFIGYSVISALWSNYDFYDIFSRLNSFIQSFLLLVVCEACLNNVTYKKLINFFYFAQIINVFLTGYEKVVLNMNPDFCNGIFGFTGYSNGTTGIFSLALSLLAVVYFMSHIWSFTRSFLIIICSSMVCAFAEIKIYYVLFLVGIVIILMLQKKTINQFLKSILILFAIVLAFFLAYQILLEYFPYNLNSFFSVNNYIRYDERSDYAGRLNTIPFIYNNLFINNIFTSFFGTGLGSNSSNYIYELGKIFSDLGFIGIIAFAFTLLTPTIQVWRSKERNAEQLFVAVFSIIVGIGIVVWNIPFVRAANIIVFFFLSIENRKWKTKYKVSIGEKTNGTQSLSNSSSL